jgi:choline kinase
MPAEPCRAIVLAAGRGSRLGALTATRPKCLVELAGRSLLDWQTAALHAAGITRLGIVRGYRAHDIARPALQPFDNQRWQHGNMVASLLCARSWLRAAPCLVVYGDVVFHPQAARALRAADADVALTYDRAWRALWSARFARPEDDCESFRSEGGRLVEIGRRVTDLDAVQGQFMGLVRFTPAGWRAAEAVIALGDASTLQTTELLQRLVEHGVAVATLPVRGRWCEVDDARDLALYEHALRNPGWTHDWRQGWSDELDGGSS